MNSAVSGRSRAARGHCIQSSRKTGLQKERTDLETAKVLYREGRTIMTYFSKETEKSEKINSELMAFCAR